MDEVVFVVPRSRLNSLQGAIEDCETEGVVVTVAVDLFDTKLARSSVAELDGMPLLHFKTTHAKEWELSSSACSISPRQGWGSSSFRRFSSSWPS